MHIVKDNMQTSSFKCEVVSVVFMELMMITHCNKKSLITLIMGQFSNGTMNG